MPLHEPVGRKPLIVIVGPTAVGKTEIAIQLAKRINGEIVSADSRLFYRGMDIGTAKPTPSEREQVPHHLIDIANPDQVWNLALFQREARQIIHTIHSRNRTPLLVGGTGQYVRAIVEGWDIPKVEPNTRLRTALEHWAVEIDHVELHKRLSALDKEAAKQIDPHNLRRTIRALEVILSTGYRFSIQKQHKPPPYQTLIIGLTRPRPELYARIDARIRKMLDDGFVEEVRNLLAQGYSEDLPTLSAIGYQEIITHLQGKTSLDEAVSLMKRRTRNFVRRQANWFKAEDEEITWFRVTPQTIDEMEASIVKWLREIRDNP